MMMMMMTLWLSFSIHTRGSSLFSHLKCRYKDTHGGKSNFSSISQVWPIFWIFVRTKNLDTKRVLPMGHLDDLCVKISGLLTPYHYFFPRDTSATVYTMHPMLALNMDVHCTGIKRFSLKAHTFKRSKYLIFCLSNSNFVTWCEPHDMITPFYQKILLIIISNQWIITRIFSQHRNFNSFRLDTPGLARGNSLQTWPARRIPSGHDLDQTPARGRVKIDGGVRPPWSSGQSPLENCQNWAGGPILDNLQQNNS